MNTELALFQVGIAVFVVILAVLWLLLPFAVFGIKSKLDELVNLEKLQLENLRRMRRQICNETDDEPRKQ